MDFLEVLANSLWPCPMYSGVPFGTVQGADMGWGKERNSGGYFFAYILLFHESVPLVEAPSTNIRTLNFQNGSANSS